VSKGDPRVFFAAERTVLAWVRSGITVMGIGFVVARFGLFLQIVGASSAGASGAHHAHWPSNALGIVLVLLGSSTILGALYNHYAYVRTLPAEDVPSQPLPWMTPFVCVTLAVVGFVLAAYLALA
jgi:putative membrane protein